MGAVFNRLGRAVTALVLTTAGVSAFAVFGAPSHAQAAGPPDGTWVCSVPAGYTWDAVANNLAVCNPSGFANSYHLRIPAADLWVCWVPPGWTYDSVANNLAVCNPSGFANSYHLPGTPPTTTPPTTSPAAQPTITGSPATLALPPNAVGTSVVSWNAPHHNVSIYVSFDGGTQQLFANGGATGSATAPWIMEPHVYVFNLYVQGYSDQTHLLASTTVRGVPAPPPPPTTTPPTTTPPTTTPPRTTTTRDRCPTC